MTTSPCIRFARLAFLGGAVLLGGTFCDGAAAHADCSTDSPSTCAYVPVGSTQSVTPTAFAPADPVCAEITNGCAAPIMAPTATENEWLSFLTSVQNNTYAHNSQGQSCASIAPCATAQCGSATVDASGNVTSGQLCTTGTASAVASNGTYTCTDGASVASCTATVPSLYCQVQEMHRYTDMYNFGDCGDTAYLIQYNETNGTITSATIVGRKGGMTSYGDYGVSYCNSTTFCSLTGLNVDYCLYAMGQMRYLCGPPTFGYEK